MIAIKILLVSLLGVYIGSILGLRIAFKVTTFVPPHGLWILVPFRVGGWWSESEQETIRFNWTWQGHKAITEYYLAKAQENILRGKQLELNSLPNIRLSNTNLR